MEDPHGQAVGPTLAPPPSLFQLLSLRPHPSLSASLVHTGLKAPTHIAPHFLWALLSCPLLGLTTGELWTGDWALLPSPHTRLALPWKDQQAPGHLQRAGPPL